MGKKMTTAMFIAKANQKHNNKYDYSHTVYFDSRSDVTITCPVHGDFAQKAASHLIGCGCPKCAREWSDEHRQNLKESARKSRGMSTEEWIAKAKFIHGDKYDYSQTVYVNQRTDVIIVCPIHGAFLQKADSHIRGFGCKKCGNESENRKGKHNWSMEQYVKTAATCKMRYGATRYLDSSEGKTKLMLIRSDPKFRNKMREIISSDEVQSKMKSTSFKRYGVEFPTKTKAIQDKIYKTKKKNHTVNSSKSEEHMYALLVERFGKNDVDHQYKYDSRYPFVCDFYVKSLDLFIELNAHWSHGGHWFDSNSTDMQILSRWQVKAKNSNYYQCAIDTWTIRDIEKRKMAVKNRLNYVVFWKNDLSDFIDWIESEPLVLNNIL